MTSNHGHLVSHIPATIESGFNWSRAWRHTCIPCPFKPTSQVNRQWEQCNWSFQMNPGQTLTPFHTNLCQDHFSSWLRCMRILWCETISCYLLENGLTLQAENATMDRWCWIRTIALLKTSQHPGASTFCSRLHASSGHLELIRMRCMFTNFNVLKCLIDFC